MLWDDGEPIEIPEGKKLTLDLNGVEVMSHASYPVFWLKQGAELTIVDNGEGYPSHVYNSALPEGAEMDNSWTGLLKTENDTKLILAGGYFSAGDYLFTNDSTGEIILEVGCIVNKLPLVDYRVTEWGRVYDYEDADRYDVFSSVGANLILKHSIMDEEEGIDLLLSGVEQKFLYAVSNMTDFEINIVDLQVGYTTDKSDESAFVPFETDIDYKDVSVEAEDIQTILFKGTIPQELVATEIWLVCKTKVTNGDGTIREVNWIERVSCYKLTVGLENSIDRDDVSKPVDNVIVVQNSEMEQAVGKATNKVVGDILSGQVNQEMVSEETANKIEMALESGKFLYTQIVVKEMSTEQVQQISTIDKKAIDTKVAAELGENANVKYLDISLILKADDEELGTLNQLEEEITITVAIPEELKAKGRTYKVIRNHNGEVTALDAVVNEDETLSFKTDRFSTYALAYADEEGTTGTNPDQGNKPSEGGSKPTEGSTQPSADDNKNSNAKPSTAVQAPQTGDSSSVLIYIAIGLVAMYVIVVIKKRRTFVK